MNILIYFPYNQRTVEQQSVMEILVKRGHGVVLLTTCDRGYLHDYVEGLGVKTEAMTVNCSNKFAFYARNLLKLSRVIRQHRIDLVIAHQQIPALIAGILRTIRKFKLVYFRHNSDEDYQGYPIKAKWLNRIVNLMTPTKVAPSSVVRQFWIDGEGVARKDIVRINYGYNFQQYERPDQAVVERIRKDYPAELRVLSIARYAPTKRHKEMFAAIARLVNEGEDVKLICLGSGPIEDELRKLIDESGLQQHIFLVGRKDNIFDYIEAADVFLHLSSSEASNSAVKEVGLGKRPVIVCKGVGDFDDYIIDNQNGFRVNKEDPVEEAYQVLKTFLSSRKIRAEAGMALHNTVTEVFNINKVVSDYECLLNHLHED